MFKTLHYKAKSEVKQKIKQSVPENELVLITVSVTDNKSLKWTKPNKEFRYKGEMYDIVRQETKDEMISYSCIHDFKESKLFANINEHIQRHIADNPIQRKKANILLKRMFKVFYCNDLEFISFPTTFKLINYKNYLQAYNSIYIHVLDPPPKFA